MTDECSGSSNILIYVICTNPAVNNLDEDDITLQAGLVVADTNKQNIFFMQEEKVAMFKDIRTAAQYLRYNRKPSRCHDDW